MAAGLSLHPEDDPSIPSPQPDVSIFGILGKVSYTHIYIEVYIRYMKVSPLYFPLVSISACLEFINLFVNVFICVLILPDQ
jgi:hypothetical protein